MAVQLPITAACSRVQPASAHLEVYGEGCCKEGGERERGRKRLFVCVGVWSSGDLPQQHAVNQSDLDRTGTHLVAAPANTGTARERKRVRDLHFIWSREDTKRWIDGS